MVANTIIALWAICGLMNVVLLYIELRNTPREEIDGGYATFAVCSMALFSPVFTAAWFIRMWRILPAQT